MLYVVVGFLVAMVVMPVSYAFGSAVAYGKVLDWESSYMRISLATRLLIHSADPKEPSGEFIQRLQALVDACDESAGIKQSADAALHIGWPLPKQPL